MQNWGGGPFFAQWGVPSSQMGRPSMIGATMPNMMRTGDGSSSTTVAGRTSLPSSLVQQLVAMSAAAGQHTEQGYTTPPTVTHEDVFHSPESQRGPADAMITIATNQLEVANQ
eukprot:3042747-Pyramimonas_sp.AAC.1